jgi:hypothetical protein
VSSLSFVVPDGTGHTATPKGGTYVRERDGEPAILTIADDYPVTAECARCGRRIRLGHLVQWEWQHTPGSRP